MQTLHVRIDAADKPSKPGGPRSQTVATPSTMTCCKMGIQRTKKIVRWFQNHKAHHSYVITEIERIPLSFPNLIKIFVRLQAERPCRSNAPTIFIEDSMHTRNVTATNSTEGCRVVRLSACCSCSCVECCRVLTMMMMLLKTSEPPLHHDSLLQAHLPTHVTSVTISFHFLPPLPLFSRSFSSLSSPPL